jgi:dipeptidyl aminopeptidase/acylaminoacyl peptidase
MGDTMPKLAHISVACAAALIAAAPAAAKPPIEAFGEVPEIRAMEISPDGKRVAYLHVADGVEHLVLYDLTTKKAEALAKTGDFKTRGVSFPTDDYVILHASLTTRNVEWMTDRFEHTSAFSVNLKTKKAVQLLTKADWLHPAQSGLGRMLGISADGKYALMPAYILRNQQLQADPNFDLLKVNLDTGVGTAIAGRSGVPATKDWIVNAEGEVVAREDFSSQTEEYSIRVYDNGGSREIFNRKGKDQSLGVVGLTADGKSLIVSDRQDSEFYSLYEMSMADGSLKGPLLKRDDADIASIMVGKGREVIGVGYTGMFPSYEIFDPALEADIKGIQAKLPESAVRIDSWSQDRSRILLFVSGGGLSERYILLDRKARTTELIAAARPAIKAEDVGQVITIEYKAADGLKIPALITWPTGVAEADRKNLPLLVIPHGGPEAYDAVGFDWLAQYFANEGYMVFQPNFRGSGGFGESFATAGHGEWGRKMQSDITDGVRALTRMGWADGSRACILGGSYGGYAALAGGAMTPELYKCVVAIAGVANLREMLGAELRDHGPRSSTYRYWVDVIGDPAKDADRIEAVSPANLADKFQAPVLLIHGTDDLIVPARQSELMESALKKAGKNVTYMKLKGDDHYLSKSENRRDALQAMSSFVAKHIGGRQ